MSVGIWGLVELKRNNRWMGVLELRHVLTSVGGYVALEILLDTPIAWETLESADLRGLPADRSDEAREIWGDLNDLETTTWVGWDEIEAVDWSAQDADQLDDWQRLIDLIEVFRRDKDIEDVRLLIEFA